MVYVWKLISECSVLVKVIMDWKGFRDMTLDTMRNMYVEEGGLSDKQAEGVVYMSEFEPGFWKLFDDLTWEYGLLCFI